MTRSDLLRLDDLVFLRAHWLKMSRDAYLRAGWFISSSIERYGARNPDDSFLRAYCRQSTSFSIVLVDRALVSTMRLMEKNARNAFFLSYSIANLKDPFRLNVIPR